MVTSTFDISHGGRVKAARGRADGDCLRYRLDVIAASARDVVQSAGGWLYDRAMAGWRVTVLLPDGSDTRSLRILGVQALDVEEYFATRDPAATSESLAVSAEAFAADARVREQVLESLDDRMTEVALWGQAPTGWPLRVDRGVARAQYRLSAAALRFKGHALAAAGIDCPTVYSTETLLCDLATCGRGDSGLVRLD
ncbi:MULTISPECIES: hypothetical protein [unclassified Mycobacterium]|uniref:hypothetical protein n=1 Tax=unclassified Mycobacterium TaxID=2642494 RepID=UPI0007FD8D97|nr:MULTISPECIES: hypothetical protein [unclassified Mycobacterium]OBG60409.1 hypothetical protein A5704_19220 [Mycobacterium sp. E735]OBG60544.1 hypothetical protein A5703_24285 [Mycobacterium sp. E188]OBG74932.1 hypothetical protein A5701_21695 [Mycobacterium sp. E3305]OBG79768.1 hypothetical protein A9X05_21825 [Mycobacterium sp. E3298]OBH21514.1 hypothetical protein A9X03_16710 [Mycobacterium sp. E1715]